jgi:branched-chain amino acid transport system permease protein
VPRSHRIAWAIAIVLALALPALVPKSYQLAIFASAFISAISVYGLNVILGYTGLLNLAHASFFGVGAYSVALLETNAHWNFYPALLAGCAISVLLGAIVGLISLRTRGNYFAIFTAAVGVMITIVFTNASWTGGNIGIVNIPGPPNIGSISFDDAIPKYYLVLVALALTIALCVLVRRSLIGRSFTAVAANEDLARATGINVFQTKMIAFMFSTFIAGLAGGLYAVYNGSLGPDASTLDITFEQLIFLVVGGLGTIAGPLIGTVGLSLIGQGMQGFQQYRFLVYGPLLVVLIIFFPRGLAGIGRRLRLPQRHADVDGATDPEAIAGQNEVTA